MFQLCLLNCSVFCVLTLFYYCVVVHSRLVLLLFLQLQRKHEEDAQNLQFQLMYGDTLKDKELTKLKAQLLALEQEIAQVKAITTETICREQVQLCIYPFHAHALCIDLLCVSHLCLICLISIQLNETKRDFQEFQATSVNVCAYLQNASVMRVLLELAHVLQCMI